MQQIVPAENYSVPRFTVHNTIRDRTIVIVPSREPWEVERRRRRGEEDRVERGEHGIVGRDRDDGDEDEEQLPPYTPAAPAKALVRP